VAERPAADPINRLRAARILVAEALKCHDERENFSFPAALHGPSDPPTIAGRQLQVIFCTTDPPAKRLHANHDCDQFLSISTGRTHVKRCISRHFVTIMALG
jgi:hypothetical protein